MNRLILAAGMLLALLPAYGQESLLLTEQTLRIGSEENLYYGFAAGDEITISLREVDGKELKEVELLHYPDKVIYSTVRISALEKTLTIPERGVYQFRFRHGGIGNRVCQLSLRRKPGPDARDFNTNITWVEQVDTLYKYETRPIDLAQAMRPVERTRRIVASVDTVLETLIDRVERVHSSANLSGNEATISFQIPAKQYIPNAQRPDRVTEVVSWTYAIATGEAAALWYKDANKRAAVRTVAKSLVTAGLVSTGYGAIALLAIEGVNLFSSPPSGENTIFSITTQSNGSERIVAQGNSIAAIEKVSRFGAGKYTVLLSNDNIIDAINVDLKIILVKVVTTYRDETYLETPPPPTSDKEVVRIISGTQIKRVPRLMGRA